MRKKSFWQRNGYRILSLFFVGSGASGCGSDYVVFHPAGPVAQDELHVIVLSTIVMGVIIVGIWILFAYVVVRFRDTPNNKAPYRPNWIASRPLEVTVFAIPLVVVILISIPTVKKTYSLAYIPTRHPLVIDVTSFDYKWLFEYPRQHIATVNYFYLPTHQPTLFELTAHSPLNTFWVPNLGGMEYTMPNRVLPLWLEANRPGTYLGRSANFSGIDFWRMTFKVHAVSSQRFRTWAQSVKDRAPAMSRADYHQLLQYDVAPEETYSSYPPNTFPSKTHQFTVRGPHYVPQHKL